MLVIHAAVGDFGVLGKYILTEPAVYFYLGSSSFLELGVVHYYIEGVALSLCGEIRCFWSWRGVEFWRRHPKVSQESLSH